MSAIGKVIVAIVLPWIFTVITLRAAPSWSLAGLKGEKVNVVLPMSGFGGEALMVGTDKGIWWSQSGEWQKAWTGLPVHDMAITASGEPLAVAGNGSDSDGVYLGKITGIAKRTVGGSGIDTWWGFSFQQRYYLPTAVAVRRPLDSNCGSVFVGNSTGVASGSLCNGALGELIALPGPENSLGTELASMMVYSVNSQLYVGGNFNRPINAMVLPPSSWLLKGTDTLTRFKELIINTLVELHTQKELLIEGTGGMSFDPNVKLIAAGTVDSGIQIFEGDYLFDQLPSPVQNEPVLAIVPFNKIRTHLGFSLTMLAAATPSGVFRQCSPDSSCTWRELGDLPRPPVCLAQYNGATLWAGTDSGVYRYDYSTAVRLNTLVLPDFQLQLREIRLVTGGALFVFNGNKEVTGTLSIFDVKGRCVKNDIAVTGGRTAVKLCGGLYLFRIIQENQTIAKGRFVCR